MSQELLFSVTKKDFVMQTFRAGGKGGQNQNKVASGVRLIHKPSGARAESRVHREQVQNKKDAFKKLVKTKEFVAWHSRECALRLGTLQQVEQKVEDWMDEKFLKIEFFEPRGA